MRICFQSHVLLEPSAFPLQWQNKVAHTIGILPAYMRYYTVQLALKIIPVWLVPLYNSYWLVRLLIFFKLFCIHTYYSLVLVLVLLRGQFKDILRVFTPLRSRAHHDSKRNISKKLYILPLKV